MFSFLSLKSHCGLNLCRVTIHVYFCYTGMKLGFESINFVRIEGNMTGVRVRINGENIRDFEFDYLQGIVRVIHGYYCTQLMYSGSTE